ncbi:MAG: hypothetical protein L3I99_02500 [Sulfurimonas sp.]|nr:hypothetical protein [Sulfurimonas sp.]
MNTLTSSFDDEQHKIILSEDGSYTAYSKEYDEHYHSLKDGALNESLSKHVIAAFKFIQKSDEINILDICFGLGFNTLATLYYVKQNNIKAKINIYSPELDTTLIESLRNFTYPKEFEEFKEITIALANNKVYKNESWHVSIYLGNAREYIKEFSHAKFDIIYQDAFSPSSNPILWTKEYFKDLANIIKKDGIITTYSVALKTRLALYENGFNVYLYSAKGIRDSTIASFSELYDIKKVDMLHKISCNKDVKALSDDEVSY